MFRREILAFSISLSFSHSIYLSHFLCLSVCLIYLSLSLSLYLRLSLSLSVSHSPSLPRLSSWHAGGETGLGLDGLVYDPYRGGTLEACPRDFS